MEPTKWSTDQVLGVGGYLGAAAGFALHVAAAANPEVEVFEAVASVFWILILAWIIAIVRRHRRVYPDGAGRGYLVAAWSVIGMSILWIGLVAADPGLEGDSWWDRLPHLEELIGFARWLLVLPLALAATAILSDARAADSENRRKVRRV